MGFTSFELIDLRVVVADSRAGTQDVDEGKRRAFLMRKEVTQ